MSCKPDTQTTRKMYKLYEQGYSVAQVGKAFGVSRQTVHLRFVRRGLCLRPRVRPLPFIVFEGRKYTLRTVGYYGCTSGTRDYLHRDVWRATHGVIPVGYDVHHKDRDKANNGLDNLALITKSEHSRLYNTGANQHTTK